VLFRQLLEIAAVFDLLQKIQSQFFFFNQNVQSCRCFSHVFALG